MVMFKFDVVGKFVLSRRMTDVVVDFFTSVSRWASFCFIKCFDVPLYAFVTILAWCLLGWATGKVVEEVKLLWILQSILLLNTGPAFQVIFLTLPPIRFCRVASFLCPSTEVRHSGLVWWHRPCQYLVRFFWCFCFLGLFWAFIISIICFIISICCWNICAVGPVVIPQLIK